MEFQLNTMMGHAVDAEFIAYEHSGQGSIGKCCYCIYTSDLVCNEYDMYMVKVASFRIWL